MNPLTAFELRMKQAELALKAEALRQEWRRQPTGNRALMLGKQAKDLQARADDYSRLIEMAVAL